VHKPV